MTFSRITTAGAGTMGSQIAWQMAFHGKHVTVYDAIPAGLEKGRVRDNHRLQDRALVLCQLALVLIARLVASRQSL
jgi:3-hydroxyacyl-CoA dehydrogenase